MDINVILTGLIAPVAVLLVKTLLDFSLAHFLVKYISWIPTRGMFRDNPHDLSGLWEQTWGAAGSPNFQPDTARHGQATIKQFGRYCFAEFVAKGRRYQLFGKIRNNYLIGEWYDKSDKNAYFGAFELQINIHGLEGRYVGHSSRDGKVGQDVWIWSRVN